MKANPTADFIFKDMEKEGFTEEEQKEILIGLMNKRNNAYNEFFSVVEYAILMMAGLLGAVILSDVIGKFVGLSEMGTSMLFLGSFLSWVGMLCWKKRDKK